MEVTATLSSKEYVPSMFKMDFEEYKRETETLKVKYPWMFDTVVSSNNSQSIERVQENSLNICETVVSDLLKTQELISFKTISMVALHNVLARAGISSFDIDELSVDVSENKEAWLFYIFCKDEVVDSIMTAVRIDMPVEIVKNAQKDREEVAKNSKNLETIENITLEEAMSRDWTPEELYDVDKKLHFERIENEFSEYFPNLAFVGEGALRKMKELGLSDEEISVFEAELTTIINNKNIGIPVANWMRQDIDDTLRITATWFKGKLDQNFYYRENNDEMFARAARNIFFDKSINEFIVEIKEEEER